MLACMMQQNESHVHVRVRVLAYVCEPARVCEPACVYTRSPSVSSFSWYELIVLCKGGQYRKILSNATAPTGTFARC